MKYLLCVALFLSSASAAPLPKEEPKAIRFKDVGKARLFWYDGAPYVKFQETAIWKNDRLLGWYNAYECKVDGRTYFFPDDIEVSLKPLIRPILD